MTVPYYCDIESGLSAQDTPAYYTHSYLLTNTNLTVSPADSQYITIKSIYNLTCDKTTCDLDLVSHKDTSFSLRFGLWALDPFGELDASGL